MNEPTFENLMFDLLNNEEKCRICLKKGSLHNIQSNYSNQLKIYDMLVKINCFSDANSSQEICQKCLEKLKNAYEFTLNFDEATQYYKSLNPYFSNEQNSIYESKILDKSNTLVNNDQNSICEPTIAWKNNPYVNNEQRSAYEPTILDQFDTCFNNEQNFFYEATIVGKNIPYVNNDHVFESTFLDKNNHFVNKEQNSFYEPKIVDKNDSYVNSEQNSAFKSISQEICTEYPEKHTSFNEFVLNFDESYFNDNFNNEQNSIYEPTNNKNISFDNNEHNSVFEPTILNKNNYNISSEQNCVFKSTILDQNNSFINNEQNSVCESTIVDKNNSYVNNTQNSVFDSTILDYNNLYANNHQNSIYKPTILDKNNFSNCYVRLEKITLKKNSNKNKSKIKRSFKKKELISRKKQIENILKKRNPFLTEVEYIDDPFSKHPRNKRVIKNNRGRPSLEENLKKNRILVVSSSAIEELFTLAVDQKLILPSALEENEKNLTVRTEVFPCNSCNKLFLTESIFDAHDCFGEPKVHLSLKTKEIKCEHCQRRFKNIVFLSKHVCFVFKCLKCKTIFNSNEDLEKHEKCC